MFLEGPFVLDEIHWNSDHLSCEQLRGLWSDPGCCNFPRERGLERDNLLGVLGSPLATGSLSKLQPGVAGDQLLVVISALPCGVILG